MTSLLVLSLAVAGVVPVAAQDNSEANSEPQRLTLSEIFPNPQLLSEHVIAAVNVDPYRLGIDGLIQAHVNHTEAQAEMADALHRFSESSEGVADWLVAEAESLAGFESAVASADAAEQNLKEFAVGAFSGSELRDLEGEVLSGRLNRQVTLQDYAEDRVLHVKSRADTQLVVAEQLLLDARRELKHQSDLQALAEVDLYQAINKFDSAVAQIAELTPAAEVRLATTEDPKLGFTVVALDAYFNAQVLMAEADPNCGVEWWQLAGIGRVESIHGTHGRSKVKSNGVTTRRILGPPLDGEEFLAIPDTDGGKLDGDLVWDRAVGPMQFIPGSWRIFSADGDGDRKKDPHNMYDSTVAAARHLCNSVRNIGASGRFRRALLDYNRDAEYGATVQRFALRYESEVDLVLPPEPTPEQKPFCVPEPDEIKMVALIGCRAMSGPGRAT